MVARLSFISPEEYLILERKAEYKSEYINGQIYAMAGGTPEHNLVAGNVLTALNIALRKRPCQGTAPGVTPTARSPLVFSWSQTMTEPGHGRVRRIRRSGRAVAHRR